MSTKMETAEREDKLLGDMLDIIRFTEGVSAKLHRVMDEAKIYQVVREEFAKTDHYTASILLLADDGASLRLAETSIAPSKLEVLEKASGLRAKEYRIKLSKSSIYTQVVKEGKTVRANVSDIIREFLPRPLAYLISKTMGYEKQSSILTPLYRQRKVIGVLAMSCTDLCEYFLHSVENLALHISTALELAHKNVQRDRALQALKRYHAHLGELVEERTGELKTVNEELREEITERKQAEEALQAEKNKLQSLIAAMEDGFNIRDTDYNIIYQNEPIKITFGDHVGGKCYRAYGGQEKVCDGCPAEKAFSDGQSHTTEMRLVMPSGEVTFWEVTANPVRDAGGRIISCLEIMRNITERKGAEEALERQKAYFQQLFDNSPDAIAWVDADDRFVNVNKGFEQLFGYRAEEIKGRFINATIIPEDRMEEASVLSKARFSNKMVRVESVRKRKDGSLVDVSIIGYPIRFGNETVGAYAIYTDITERKQAEEALQAEKNKLQSLIDTIEDGFNIRDTDYNLIYQNEPERRIWGDHVGEKCYRVYEDREEVCEGCPVEKAFRDGKSHTSERRVVMPSGEVIFWENIANPVRDAGGEIISCLEVTRNITERKKAEEALRESREKLQKMFESVTDGISVVDLNGVIIEANQRAVEMHGFTSKDELLGRNALEIVAPRDRERIAANMRKAIKEGAIRGVEYSLPRADGSEFPGELSTSVIRDASGKAVAHITIVRDITERKQAEEALQAERNKLQSLIDAMECGLNIQDIDHNIIYQNEFVRRIYGDHLGEKCYRVYEGKEKVCDGCPVEEAFRDGKSHTAERRVIIPSGEVTFWENTASPIRDARGEIVTCLEVTRNITERKQAEEALADEVTRRRILVDQSRDGIVVLDENAKVYEANQRFAEMLGYTPEEVRELHTWDWDTQWPREQLLEMGRKVDEKGLRLETYHRRKDGTVIDVDISVNGAMCGGQKLIFCVCRDITARKQVEEALQAEKNKLQSLIDAMEDGLTIQDTDYNLIYQNEPVRRRHGDHLGEKCYRVYEGREKVCEGCPVEEAFSDGKSHTTERRIVLPSGEVTFWEVTANPVRDARGEIVSCVEVPRNITERKQAEEALNLQRAYFQQLFDNSPDAIALLAKPGRVVQVNKGFEALFGYQAEEAKGRHIVDVIVPEDRLEETKALTKAALSGKAVRKETVRRRKDGSLVDVSLVRYPIRFGSEMIGTYVIYTDITERKQSEERLKLLSSVTQQISDATLVTNLDFNITYVNKAAQDLFGYSAEEMLGKHMDFFNVEIPSESFKQELVQTVCSGGLWVGTLVKRRKDGSTFLSECHISQLYDKQGQISSYIDVLRDVTELRQAEEALRESQKFSSSLLESSPNPITVVNLDTSTRYVNPAFEKLTGFTLAEIVGRKAPYPWWPEGERERILAAFKDAIKHGGRRTGSEHYFQKKNGEHFWVTLNSAPVVQDGKPVYLIISWLDITERKRAEEKEKQMKQELYLAQRLASVGELAAGVAHEINNPLTGVLGFSQRLMRKSTDEAVSRDLEIIHSEARRAADVVQNLLTFARRRQPKKEYSNVNDIVQKTLELRSYALQTSNIEVATALASSLPKVMVDFPQMQEVFLNIILNAEQAMSEAHGRGKLIIKSRRMKDYVRISFADDGPGVSPENLDKVFDPFFTTREQKGGTGLGLSACHGIVTEHGGRIYARSKPGKGATFFVDLPLPPVETNVTRRV